MERDPQVPVSPLQLRLAPATLPAGTAALTARAVQLLSAMNGAAATIATLVQLVHK